MNSIGALISSRRKALGISAAAFARELGVTNQAVWNWENRPGSAPAREHLVRIAEVLRLGLGQLLEPAVAPNRLQPEKERLLASFRLLNDSERALVLKMLEGLKRE